MSTPLHFRCPGDVFEALEAKAKVDGTDRTTAIIKALRVGLGLEASPEDTPRLSGKVDQLAAQLAAVIAQVAELQAPPAQLAQAATTPVQPTAPRPVDGQLSILETIAPQAEASTPASPSDTAEEWMHVKQAFQLAGGDLDNPASVVLPLDGGKGYKFNTFRLKANDLTPFGFERHPDNGALVRPLPVLLQRLAVAQT